MKSRKTVELTERFDRRWLGYAAAAGAAGLLAAAQPARADIIYTPADISLSGGFGLQFGCGGAVDVEFPSVVFATSCSWCRGGGEVIGKFNAVVDFWSPSSGGRGLNAGPLPKGFKIGPMSSKFGSTLLMGWLSRSFPRTPPYMHSSYSFGPWAGQEGYIAVKFAINSQIHYGWVEASGGGKDITTTGWAYNTVPNAPIDAGQTTAATPEPGTLGLLALGSLGLGFWRRRKAVASQQ